MLSPRGGLCLTDASSIPIVAEIAAELFVSDGTVKTHINHLFTKLQLRDRAAAVIVAFDHDLVTPQEGSSGRTRRSQ